MYVLPLGRFPLGRDSKIPYKRIVWCERCEHLRGELDITRYCKLHKIMVSRFSGFCYEIDDEMGG